MRSDLHKIDWSRYRVYFLLILVFAVMALIAPRFLTVDNQIALLKKASIHMIPAVGFTLVLAIGQLDLSFASVMTLGGMLTLGFQPRFGWFRGLAAAAACGLGIGLINGLLVSKARVSSFIVTLGTLAIVQGVVNIYSHGNTLSVDDTTMFQWLDARSPLAPPIVFALTCVPYSATPLQGRFARGTGRIEPIGRCFMKSPKHDREPERGHRRRGLRPSGTSAGGTG